jgi:hypothetical protein
MKQWAIFILLLGINNVYGQKLLPLPAHPQAGKCYKQCLKYDSTVVNADIYAVIPPFGWEEVLLQRTEAQQRVEIEAPRFDTVLLKIPVDKVTRMAQLPDEYGLIKYKVKLQEPSTKWTTRRGHDSDFGTNISNCLALCLVEMPAEYKTIEKLALKATAYQRRYDDADTVVFRQVVETRALVKKTIEIPPQYKRLFIKKNPYAIYSGWTEALFGAYHHPQSDIKSIQKQLQIRGYYLGELDNLYGIKTKAALIRFQRDNNLPCENLNVETLKALNLFKNYGDYDD